jgi:putative peptide zinc metalloprotease protein
MPTLADSIVSSSSRKLSIRARPDLKARKQRYQGRTYWVVKDPVGLQYFRFEEEEFAILQMLDGQSSLDDISERFEAEFPPQTIRVEELQNFIGMLHKSGLVLSDAPGQGWALKERRDDKKRRELLGALSNVLAFRMRGIDPERLLNWLYPYVRWFFTPATTIGALLLAAAALTLVIVQFDVFKSRLPDFNSFFAAKHWLALAATLTATKILHEFGHGMSCKHFGGECHEMGVMFLVMTPCLYCNVSDSWMLPNRWHRAAIGAAGMYVEVVLASICTFIWWFSDPTSALNNFCLNVMFVSSVSTIMFNANPLLRYDGYYILSDILEIPNLRQKASSILNRKLGKWCLGLEEQEDPFLPKRHQALFALYTVASALYRWVVLFSILFFLNKVFEPYGLKVLGQMLAVASIYGMFFMPARAVWKFFRVPGRLSKVKRVRLYVTLAILAAAVASLFLVPLPMRVIAPFELQPYDADSVYVEVPGTLIELGVKPGEQVKKGQLIAQLQNLELEMQIAQLQGDQASLETELENLETLLYQPSRGEDAAAQYDATQQALANVKEQLAQKESDLARLRLVAPRDGVVIPPPRSSERERDADALSSWTGTPLDRKNLGASFSPQGQQNLICMIGDPNEWDATMIISQDDYALVKEGQEVRLMFEESAYHVFISTISQMNDKAVDVASPRLASVNGGPMAAQQNPDGSLRPLSTSFEAIARLNDPQGLLRNGLIGTARIEVEPRTIMWRVWRYLGRTFNFEL